MRIELGTMRQSPFVGVFSIATEKAVFVPTSAEKKELRKVQDLFGVEAVKASIANSSLLGVFAVANKKGILASSLIEEKEVQEMRETGFKVKAIENTTALGNIVAVNDSKGVCSTLFSEKQRKEMEKFLGIELKPAKVAGSDLVGSSMVVTNQGFLVSPNAKEKEFERIKRHLNVKGEAATANYGDAFVGNSVVAAGQAALAGLHSTGHELARIDEGLSA